MSRPRIALVAALDENQLIGADGGMPWHIPGELKRFRRITEHKTVLMGRRTYASIGRPLPNRRNLVLTRQADFTAAGCERVASLDEAIACCTAADELMVIGGAQVYALALPEADLLQLTQIEARYSGDTHFPEVDWNQWQLTAEERVPGRDGVPAHRFMTWERLRA